MFYFYDVVRGITENLIIQKQLCKTHVFAYEAGTGLRPNPWRVEEEEIQT